MSYRFNKRMTPEEILKGLEASFISSEKLQNDPFYQKYLCRPTSADELVKVKVITEDTKEDEDTHTMAEIELNRFDEKLKKFKSLQEKEKDNNIMTEIELEKWNERIKNLTLSNK